jgi:hypothetical protein
MKLKLETVVAALVLGGVAPPVMAQGGLVRGNLVVKGRVAI